MDVVYHFWELRWQRIMRLRGAWHVKPQRYAIRIAHCHWWHWIFLLTCAVTTIVVVWCAFCDLMQIKNPWKAATAPYNIVSRLRRKPVLQALQLVLCSQIQNYGKTIIGCVHCSPYVTIEFRQGYFKSALSVPYGSPGNVPKRHSEPDLRAHPWPRRFYAFIFVLRLEIFPGHIKMLAEGQNIRPIHFPELSRYLATDVSLLVLSLRFRLRASNGGCLCRIGGGEKSSTWDNSDHRWARGRFSDSFRPGWLKK